MATEISVRSVTVRGDWTDVPLAEGERIIGAGTSKVVGGGQRVDVIIARETAD